MSALVLTAATGLTAVFLIPQILRVISTGHISGLSATWAVFGLVTNVAWLAYLGHLGLWAAMFAPFLAVAMYGLMLLALARRTRGQGWLLFGAVYTGFLVTLASLGGNAALGPALILAPVIQLTPAIVAAYRTRCPSGISSATWSLSIAEAVLWGWYGWLVRDPTLLGYGLVTGVGSLLVLVRRPLVRVRFRPAFTGSTA